MTRVQLLYRGVCRRESTKTHVVERYNRADMDNTNDSETSTSGMKFTFQRRQDSSKKKDTPSKHHTSFDRSDIMSSVSLKEAVEMHAELQTEYGYNMNQLVEVAGLSCATAIVKSYPRDFLTKSKAAVLVVCGPGYNGGVGLVCARYLKMFDYRPTIFYPSRPSKPGLYAVFAEQCEKQHIPFLSYMPSEAHLIGNAYNIVIDALLGCGFKESITESDVATVIQTITKSEVPIVSIDLPSGWDVDNDNQPVRSGVEDSLAADGASQFLKPDVLISLMAPKRCSRLFRGQTHYLACSFVPSELLRKYDVILPRSNGAELCIDVSDFQCPSSPLTSAQQESTKTHESVETTNHGNSSWVC